MSTREESYSGYPLWIVPLTGGDAPEPDGHPNAVRIYADENQDLRTIKSDGTDAPIGGGGSQPLDEVSGHQNSAVPPNTGTNLVWEHLSGDTLLDYTLPALPALIADGFYSVSAAAAASANSVAGGSVALNLSTLLGYFRPGNWAPVPADPGGTLVYGLVAVAWTGFIAAGDQLIAQCEPLIAESLDWFFTAEIVKLA